jgi:benzil reductase ((S)-benzoin forming)
LPRDAEGQNEAAMTTGSQTRQTHLAVVTGTSSGIGAAITEALLDDGWSVIGLSRRPSRFDSEGYHHVQADLGDLERLPAVVDAELASWLQSPNWRRLGLVNNAADPGRLQLLEQCEPQDLARVFAINAVAPMFLMGAVVRLADPVVALRIVNISSGAAVTPLSGLSSYGCSKAALRLAGMELAAELTTPQRPGGPWGDASVMSYSPGVVDTPMQVTARSQPGPWSQPFAEFHSQGLLQPPHGPAAEVAAFLASDEAEPFVERRFAPPAT